MFNLLGKKEVFGVIFWFVPAIANIHGFLGSKPNPAIYWSMAVLTSIGVFMGIAAFIRLLINYYRGSRVPLG